MKDSWEPDAPIPTSYERPDCRSESMIARRSCRAARAMGSEVIALNLADGFGSGSASGAMVLEPWITQSFGCGAAISGSGMPIVGTARLERR